MVDTNILVYALASFEGHISPHIAASFNLLRSRSEIAISAISWMELHQHIRPLQRASLGRLQRISGGRFHIVEVDAAIGLRASELMGMRAQDREVCAVCLAARRAVPCKGCKRLLSRPQRFADALIVATAESLEDIEALYTYDAGVLDMASMVSKCEIRSPALPGEARDAEPHP